MDPDHDGAPGVAIQRCGPDIGHQTVFAVIAIVPVIGKLSLLLTPVTASRMRRYWTVGERIPDSRPWRRWPRRQESRRTAGVGPVRDAFEDIDAAAPEAAHSARSDLQNRFRRCIDAPGGVAAMRSACAADHGRSDQRRARCRSDKLTPRDPCAGFIVRLTHKAPPLN